MNDNKKGYSRRDYEEAVKVHGSVRKAAAALGVSARGIWKARAAAKRRDGMDPGVVEALEKVGYPAPETLHSGWVRKQQDNGSFTSVYFLNGKAEEATSSLIDDLKDAFADLVPIAKSKPPAESMDDLLTVYPIADAHIGMQSWAKETGADYDTKIATERICTWMQDVCDSAPPSAEALILDVGDLTHGDDQKNQTPGGGHILDVDTRHFKTLDVTVQTLVHCIDTALQRHQKVTVCILKGNHNPNAYIAILFALHAYYRHEPRVEVLKQPGDFLLFEWGECLVAANHGDKAKVENTVMMLAHRYREMWGRAKWVYLFTGHKHHLKAADIGGVVWEQLRAITSSDYYAASHAWLGTAQISAITYHKHKGVRRRAYCGE